MGGTAPAPPGAGPARSGPNRTGDLRLLRLTREQLVNTLQDLVGDDGGATDLPFDGSGDSGFSEPSNVGALEARRFMDIADRASRRAAQNLAALMGCDLQATGKESACVDAFIAAFGKRAFRRPLVPEEATALRAQYDTLRAGGFAAPDAVRVLVSAILQAPSFLYHWELGPRPAVAKNGLIALGGYEIASRLSYFLWSSMPDQELFAAAEGGKLNDVDEIVRQTRRLLASDRAQATLFSFHDQWLGLGLIQSTEKDPGKFPSFTDDLRQSMAAESRQFLRSVLGTAGDGKLDTLFGASYSFVNETLAKVYDLSGVKGATLVRAELDPSRRFGLLTQGTFLAVNAHPDETHPVKRGLMVRERLLCQAVPPPPSNVKIERPVPDPKVSVREQFAQHSTDPACSTCHSQMDPLGFAFENYDAVGRFRTKSGNKDVDASGSLKGLATGPQTFSNLRDLLRLVRSSAEFRRCVGSQWLRFALGRVDGEGDQASFEAAYAAFEASGFDVRELIVALAQTASFRFRTPSKGEATL